MRRLLIPLLLIAGLTAGAADADKDERGWHSGQVAAGFAELIAPLPDAPKIELPKDVRKSITKRTLLVYFSPTCPHCTAVTPELVELAKRFEAADAELILVATGNSTEGALLEYKATYGIVTRPRLIHDTEAAIGRAMGARSTPSALMVDPVKGSKTEVQVVDAWYPYAPGFDTLVEMKLGADPFAAFDKGEYHGINTCGACHIQEAQSWALTHHSIAWMTLEKKKATEDAECTGCHVTGAGEEGGWTPDGVDHRVLVDVGCESCHGPGGPHDGEATDATSTCATCHDEKHSLAFSVEKGLPLIDHFQVNAMSEDQFVARRRALFEGTAPRELLTFGEGKVMGADACKECHADEHAQWAASGHGKAMATLEKHGSQADANCVACHATKKDFAPGADTSLAGFHVGESVGCESCHGPGEAHVAAGGGKDNIEKLGDDCPVCVIEAVCTGCHTKKWDPDWDLETDLPKVSHD